MDVTVAICTWNRAELLRRTLEEMLRLVIPDGVTWELIVINNNCTDDTDAVTQSFSDKLPLRPLWETTPGKSHALNLAVREARGEFILWTDDDALVYPDWVVSYLEAFRQWPNAAVCGGTVEPWFEVEPPAWFLQAWPFITNAYAVRDIGDKPFRFKGKMPYGVNLAFRMEMQKKYTYDPHLGRQPGSKIGGEEVALVRRMLADGAEGWWVPNAKVRHFIPGKRISLDYLENYFYGIGQQRAHEWFLKPDPKPKKMRWRLRLDALWKMTRYRLRHHFCHPKTWASDLIGASLAKGWADEIPRLGKLRIAEIEDAGNGELAPWR